MTTRPNIAFLDLETRKIKVNPPYVPDSNPNRPVTKRWQVFLAGLLLPGRGPILVDDSDGEAALWKSVWSLLHEAEIETIVYEATRSFDEAIARGTFVHARREILPLPGPWPHLASADTWSWHNLGPKPTPNPDGLGWRVPLLWDSGDEDARNKVRAHLLWDLRKMKDRYEDG